MNEKNSTKVSKQNFDKDCRVGKQEQILKQNRFRRTSGNFRFKINC